MKLDQIIPNEKIRGRIYVGFGAVGLLLGVAQTVVASLELGQPPLLTAGFAVYAYLAAAGFSVSKANTGVVTVDELSQEGFYEDNGEGEVVELPEDL